MTNYPITDPAEIAKLLPAHYLCVDGTTATRRHGKSLLNPWSVEGRELFLNDVELVDLRGGIAARFVPEDWYIDNRFRAMEAEAQRDRAMDLLHRAKTLIEQDHTCDEDGVEKFGRGYCDIHDLIADIGTFLVEQPCQRCMGEGLVVKPDAPGIRTRWYEDCPDCQGNRDRHAQKAR